MRREPLRVRAYTFAEAAVRCGVSPREIRVLVEEGRLRARRLAGTRVVDEAELERAGLLGAGEPPMEHGMTPPLAVVLERLEERSAEAAEVRRELADVQTRHAAEVKALRRELHELREASRRGPRPSLRPPLGEGRGPRGSDDADGR